MSQLHSAFTLFMSLLVEAIPFLLLGVILSSSLLLFIDERKLIALIPKNPLLGAFIGSCVGFLFPVCECGNVPVARRLLIQGIPPSVAVSFLLAAPTINPIVIWSTWIAFRDQPQVVVLRVLFSLSIATIIGWVFSVQKDPLPLLQANLANSLNLKLKNAEKPSLLQSGTFMIGKDGQNLRLDNPLTASGISNQILRQPWSYKLKLFLDNIILELRELGAVLLFGSAIAAIIQVFVPRDIVLSLGQGTISSILAMMLLAAIVSICSTVDSFFALSFVSTFTTSSILAFLVFGPMIDIKAIGLMLSIFKPRIIIYFFVLATQLTLICSLVHSYLF